MPTLAPNQFTVYELTPEERRLALSLGDLTVNWIQSELGRIAQNKINIEFDPQNPLQFAQDEAFLRGQMAFAQFLLDSVAENFVSSNQTLEEF